MATSSIQDLTQDRLYVSSREGPLQVRTMVVTHAARSLDALVRDRGPGVVDTPLGRALTDRAGRHGEATGVDAIQGQGRMIRGSDGRFLGSWYPPKEAR